VLAGAYDLVLMDCHMPVMDGFEASRALREKLGDHRPPILALTASAMREDIDRCLDAGMVEHLSKPISKEALKLALQRHLPHRPSAA
jgi:CheY-like chemotaxis protein